MKPKSESNQHSEAQSEAKVEAQSALDPPPTQTQVSIYSDKDHEDDYGDDCKYKWKCK